MDRVRIGTLGAARVTPAALIRPARKAGEAEVVAVAARDRERAQRFAEKHAIPRVHDSYEALIEDPEIDAIYNPLPNGLHALWTERALAAGKHVLCEKPFTANAKEAEEVAAVADGSGLVVIEAFHYRYHPVAVRMRELAQSGELGRVLRVESNMCIPMPLPRDIRYRYDLAGGAVMDTGCYAVHMNRTVVGAEPEVVHASTRLARPNIDRWTRAELRYPDGNTGLVTCALWSSTLLKVSVRVVCEHGTLSVFNPTGPQFGYRMTVRNADGKRRIRVEGAKKPTYEYQLEAFTAAVLRGTPVLTPPSDSIANMRVIDAIYTAAGLPTRGTELGGAPEVDR
ncbi:MAG TPA: Gfo/Idh/MocA family oxidoreductase [Acidimicrobiia bacterium]